MSAAKTSLGNIERVQRQRRIMRAKSGPIKDIYLYNGFLTVVELYLSELLKELL